MRLLTGSLIGIGLYFLSGPTLGHDLKRPELNDWYKTLQSAGSGPCCDLSEATAVEDPDWDSVDGQYRVRLEGEWVKVSPGAVLKVPNRDGRTLVWTYRHDGKLEPRCFLRGVEM